METNTTKQMKNFNDLNEQERQMIEEASERCAFILADALVRALREIDNVVNQLFKEEN